MLKQATIQDREVDMVLLGKTAKIVWKDITSYIYKGGGEFHPAAGNSQYHRL